MKPYSGEEFDPKQPVKAKTPKPYDGAEYTPSDPNNKTWGEFATDTALTIGQSAADYLLGAVGQAANVVTGGMVDEKFVKPLEKPARALLGGDPTPKGIAGITSDIDQAAQGAKSAKLQREQQELAQTRGFLDSAAKVLGSPALAFDMAAQQVPIVAGMAVGARGASKKAQTKALKDVPEPTAAQRLGAQEAGKKAAERAIVGQSAVMGGGYSANQSIQQAMALPDHVWAANPEFQALVQAGMDPQQAKEKIANRAALEPLAIGAGVNALAARLTAGLEARIFTGSVEPGGVAGLMTKEGLTKVAQTAGKEAIEEGVTEAGEQLGSNLGVQQIDPSQDPLAGVPEAAGAATVLGTGFGGGMQVVGTAISPSQGKTVVNPADGPLSKAVASTVAGTSDPAALKPVVVDDTPTRTAKQAEQAQQAEDQKAELQDAPAQNARTFKQAQSIATGQPAPVEPQPASPEEIRAELAKRADTIIDANTMKALAKRFNVPVNVISQQRRAMRQAELFGTPAEGSSATQKEVIREGVQGLPAGQQEGRQDAVQEIRQPEAAQAGGDQGGGETAQPRSADAGSPAGVRGQEDGDVTPDGDLRVALKKATQATGADGAEYTVRAFSSGEGFFFMRKTDGKATRHQSQNNAQPWSYEQAADEAAKLAGQNKDKNDVPLREKSRTSAAGDVQAPKKSPRRNAGDSNAKVAAAPVAKGADAPPAVRTEQGEAVGGGEKAQTNELRQPVAEAKGTVGEVASGRSEDAPPEPLTIRYGKRGAAPLKGTKAKPSSWIIRDKATGKAVMETTDQKKVDALNTKKYEAVPASQHLAELNDKDTKARKAAEGQDLTTIFRDAYLKAHGSERALPDQSYAEAAEQISKLVEAKDADGLFSQGLTDARSNPAVRAVFEAATGIKLPKGVQASRDAIDAWAGVTPEERAKRTQDRKEALDKEAAERQLPYTRRRAAAVKVNDDSGATTNGADYIDKLIADGYDKIVKRGTVTYLANSDGRGFRISNKNLTAYAREAVKAKQGKPERRNMAERARIDALPADERDAEIARLRADNEALRKAADTDSRTGLKNPGAYDRDVKSAKGVAAIDLTLFKGYNTLLTDAGGDAVLSVFGQAMKEVGGDQAYRRGGDEFAFLTDSPEKAQELLAQLQQRAGDIELITQGANGSLYTVSGVPFAGGVGSNEKEAIQARDEGKPKGDRNALPANVRPKDAGRSEEVGPEGKDRGGKTKAKVKTRAPTDAEKAEGIVAARGDDKAKGERKFYVTMLRDSKVARLAGPFDTKPEAEAMVEPARKAAEEADSRAAFDSFGVSGITSENHRPGVLNLKLGLPSNREIITPADDKILGKNAYDEPVYERKDGSRYVMKDGRPNFGGALVTVNEESEDQIERGLAEYGYTLKDGEIISPAGKPSGVTITVKNGRARIGTDSNKLWTGDPANIGNFLEKFWFAKKVEKDDVAFSRPDRSITDETRTENFKRWSNNAPMVTSAAAMTHEFKSGKKVVVEAFHGTQRPDRVGKYFSAKRATSGPMQYFTSDPAIASNYAKGKKDTSLSYEDVGYESWFKVKVKGARNPVNLDRAWYSFAPEVRQNIAALAPRVHLDDAGEKIILGDEGETRGIGSYDYEIKQARGNVLKALIESWLNSGALFGDETRFMDVLKTAGVPVENIVFDSPHAEFPAVIPAYIAMQNPLVTNDIPTKVDDALQAAAKRSRERGQKYGADMWDKNTRTLREWVNDYNQPDREYVWTSIPDSVTAVFKSLGYDGIVDVGGKAGGDKHKVYVPFNEDQVKGRFNKGTFDPLKKDNLLSRPDPAVTETPAFRKWFGDSKVVDAQGKPLVVYHGTQNDFTEFRPNDRNGGIFLTADRDAAGVYAVSGDKPGANIIPTYVRAQNPRFIHPDKYSFDEIESAYSANNDALITRDDDGNIGTIVVFDPAQVKSAVGNRGTFDPNNPSIVASRMEPGRPTDPTEFIMGVQSLTNGLQPQVRSWKGDAPKVRFVQSAKELPKAVQRSQGWEDVEGFYDDKTGTVWLVADNLPNLSRARQVLAHEAFGHYGVEGVVGKDEWARIVSDVAKLKSSASLSPEMKQALASTIRRYPNANPVLFAREFIAVMAERGVKSSLIGRILAKVRAWARKLGFNIDSWNEQEMRELVARGVRSVEKGGSIANNSRGAKGYNLVGRDWLEKVGGSEEKLPEGSFQDPSLPVNTGVNARMVVIEKPESEPAFSRPDPAVTETPAFRKWFGDSKVVDAQGKPLVVYHGTNADFDVFDASKAGQTDNGWYGNGGFHFTPHKSWRFAEDAAETRGGAANVMPVFVQIKNPLYGLAHAEQGSDLIGSAKRRGFDGVIVRYDHGHERAGEIAEVIALDPKQIKSAIGNRGTFDPNNPSIVASRMEPGRPTDPTEFIMGVQSLTNGLQPQVRSWKGDAPKVRFVQSAKELPKTVQRSEGWEDVEGYYDDKNGTVWLVADNLPNLSRARQVLAHEAFGHYGVEGVVGKNEWARIVSDVAKLKSSASLSPEMKQALASTIRRYPNANPVLFAREFIAVMAERGVKSSLIGRILAKVRAWARKLGFNIDSWNEQEMRELVARGVRSVEKGGSIANNSRGAKGSALSDTPDVFYSALYESLALAQGAPKKGNAQVWKGWLDGAQRRGEFKQAERDWIGVDAWLNKQDKAVTREQLADFIRANAVQVQDVVLSDAYKQAASRARDLYRQRQAQEDKVNSLRSRATDDMYSRSIRDEAAALLPDAEKELMRLDVAYETANRAAKQAIEQDTPTKFSSIQLPGGDNYRELLLTLANKDGKPNGRGLNDEEIEDLNQRFEAAGYAGGMDDEQIDLAKHGGMDAIDMLDDMEGRMGVKTSDLRAVLAGEKNADDLLRRQQSEFRSTHFDQPNILAHVRFNERTDAEGKKVLFIEEIQSDWHQQGRKRGYAVLSPTERARKESLDAKPMKEWSEADIDWYNERVNDAQRDGVPNAPFKATDEWAMLAFKRMVRWAADNGFDRVAWTTGEQQAERYDLSKQVDEITVGFRNDGRIVMIESGGNTIERVLVTDDGVIQESRRGHKGKGLDELVGKEIADKIMALREPANLRGNDLKIGGEGMRAFYDKIMPSAVNKWAKKLGGRVQPPASGQWYGYSNRNVLRGPFETAARARAEGFGNNLFEQDGGKDWHSLEVTPAMREAALQGQPLFSRPDTLAGQLNDALNSAKSLRLPSGKLLADFMDREGGLSWWHKSLGTQFNLAERYPSYKRVFDSVQGFLDDVSYYATEAMNEAPRILPQLESWKDITKQPISAQDSQAIAKPIFEGTLGFVRKPDGTVIKAYDAEGAGVVWTDQELRDRYGLNDQQISLYREFRAATDKSLTNLVKAQMVNLGGEDTQAVRARAMDAATVDEAAGILSSYLAKSAKIFPKRAKLLNQTAQQIMGKAELAKSLMSKGYAPLSRFGRHVVYVTEGEEQVYFGLFDSASDAKAMARKMQADHPEAQVETGTMSQESYKLFQGITPETLELFGEMLDLDQKSDNPADKAFQTYLKLAKNNRSALKRLIHRKGVAGYSEDPARVLASFIVSNSRLGATNLHTGETVKAIQAIPRSQGELKDQALKLFSYTRDPQEEAHALRALNFAQFLGGSIASAMVNLTQSITMTFPYLSQYGGAVKAAGRMKDAMALALKPKTGDAELDKAIKHGEEEGLLAPQEIHQLMAQARGSATLRSGDGTKAGNAIAAGHNLLAKLSLAWGKPFSVAEAYNRRAAFIAAWNTAKDQGIHAPYKFAEKAVRETQGVYSKANRPNWARGAIGSTVFTFKQFSIAYVEMLHRMATQGGPEGKKAALLALGVLFLMAGASGMPGADDLDDAIDGVMQRLGYNFSSKQAKHEFFAGILGEGGAQFVERGLSGLPGVPFDVSGRLGLGNLIPGTGLLKKKDDHSRDLTEIIGPTGDLLARAGQSANAVAAGRFGEAGLALTPVAVRNLVQGIDMASSGFYKDQRGRKVVDTTAAEAAFKAIGFQPNTVAKVQRAAGDVQQMIALNKMVEREIADEWAQGLFDKDQARVNAAREALVKWNRRNPTSRIRVDSQQLRRRLRDLRASKAQRLEKTAPAEIRREVSERLSTE